MLFQVKIKEIRCSCFFSQEEFAKEIGVSAMTITRWETGKSIPNYSARRKINAFCQKYSIDFDINKELMEDNYA